MNSVNAILYLVIYSLLQGFAFRVVADLVGVKITGPGLGKTVLLCFQKTSDALLWIIFILILLKN